MRVETKPQSNKIMFKFHVCVCLKKQLWLTSSPAESTAWSLSSRSSCPSSPLLCWLVAIVTDEAGEPFRFFRNFVSDKSGMVVLPEELLMASMDEAESSPEWMEAVGSRTMALLLVTSVMYASIQNFPANHKFLDNTQNIYEWALSTLYIIIFHCAHIYLRLCWSNKASRGETMAMCIMVARAWILVLASLCSTRWCLFWEYYQKKHLHTERSTNIWQH